MKGVKRALILDNPQGAWLLRPIAQKRSTGRKVLAETRRREITEALRSNGAVTVAELESRFGVSPMTARRDLDELERRGLVLSLIHI